MRPTTSPPPTASVTFLIFDHFPNPHVMIQIQFVLKNISHWRSKTQQKGNRIFSKGYKVCFFKKKIFKKKKRLASPTWDIMRFLNTFNIPFNYLIPRMNTKEIQRQLFQGQPLEPHSSLAKQRKRMEVYRGQGVASMASSASSAFFI